MRLEKKIKDDSISELSLSWISWLLWIPYIYAPSLDTHTPSEPDLLQSLLHYHNIMNHIFQYYCSLFLLGQPKNYINYVTLKA